MTTWEINLTAQVEDWYLNLDPDEAKHVEVAIDMLAATGPTLGRPFVDQIKGSRHHNLKELRAHHYRILFAFDSRREAVLLVAGDKSTAGWTRWYRDAIKRAEELLDQWLDDLRA